MKLRQALFRSAAPAALTLVLFGCATELAQASHLDFTLYNESPKSIYALYVTPANSSVWGRDVLGRGVLFSGESTRVTFPGQTPESPCLWDIKIVYADGTSSQRRFNLCLANNAFVAR